MRASLRSRMAVQQIPHGPADMPGREFKPGDTPKSALSIYRESQTSMPPCLVQARLRSFVDVKKPS